jgi:hypothetical protein
MVREEESVPPFDLEEPPAFNRGHMEPVAAMDVEPEEQVLASDHVADSELSADAERVEQPFVGRWNQLVSQTNWEKGQIISQWRAALIEAGAPASQYSDEAWARRVGGVTASHVGRLRRVYEAFADTYQTYRGLYWTHFLVALDWDDAPLWLEGAAQSGWSVSAMRQQRWEATGADEATRASESNLAATDVDEDFDEAVNFTQPGQGGGSAKKYEDGPNEISSGPAIEGPDFGDEDALNANEAPFDLPQPQTPADESPAESEPPLVQPFAGLPELPNDLADAVELLKLAVLRHKTAGWKDVSAETVARYLQAFSVLIEARGK